MSVKRNFLMTYSVTAYSEENRSEADRGRRKIAEMDVPDWTKTDGIETVFSGTLTLRRGDIEAQRSEALEQIFDIIKDQMKRAQAYTSCQVSIAFLVDGLGPHMIIAV
ncbi:hypothetical protein ACQKP7_20490 [Pseudomonas frederiksbergensis]|uniref:hypothetical protein n=1 Tax=Pseudomonas frederiksbergensis TaxID=104087 RepID=UPI003D008100